MNHEARDERVRQDIQLALRWTPGIEVGGIHVAVSAGTVTLTGQVTDLTARQSIEQVARGVLGVRSVVNQTRLERPSIIASTALDKFDSAAAAGPAERFAPQLRRRPA
jgi:hypothetical protein